MATVLRISGNINEEFISVHIKPGVSLIGVKHAELVKELDWKAPKEQKIDFITELHNVMQKYGEQIALLREKLSKNEFYMHLIGLGYCVSGVMELNDKTRTTYFFFIAKSDNA